MSSAADSPDTINEFDGWKVLVLESVFIPVLIFFVVMRCYARYMTKAPLWIDDYLAIISLVFQLATSVLGILFVEYGGVGRHVQYWEAHDPGVLTNYAKYLLAISSYYYLCLGWPKLSILAFYYRIFPQRAYKITIYLLAGVVVTSGIVCFVVALNLCKPFAFYWNKDLDGHCLNQQDFYRYSSLPNIITDVIMLVMPLPMIWKLHTSKHVKTGLLVTFATGSLGLATSCVRFSIFFQSSATGDGTWDSVDLMIWSTVETDVYLIAACLVTYRPIIVKLFRKTKHLSGLSKSDPKSEKSEKSTMSSRASHRRTSIDPPLSISRRPDHDDLSGFHRFSDIDAEMEIPGVASMSQTRVDVGGEPPPRDSFLPGQIHIQREWNVTSSHV